MVPGRWFGWGFVQRPDLDALGPHHDGDHAPSGRPAGALTRSSGPRLTMISAMPSAIRATRPSSRLDWPRKLATKFEAGMAVDVFGRAHLLDRRRDS